MSKVHHLLTIKKGNPISLIGFPLHFKTQTLFQSFGDKSLQFLFFECFHRVIQGDGAFRAVHRPDLTVDVDPLFPERVNVEFIAVLDDLDEDALVKILSEPKNAILKQYSYMFSLDGIELEITDDAMRAIAKKAAERKTGARGLRTVVEEALSDIMFNAPSDDTISKVILTGECVTDGKAPEVIRDPSARKNRRNSEKKTAKKNPA